MDIVEFAERFMDVKLPEWQKEYIRMLHEAARDRDIYISMNRTGLYTYLKQTTLRELTQNGATLNCN